MRDVMSLQKPKSVYPANERQSTATSGEENLGVYYEWGKRNKEI